MLNGAKSHRKKASLSSLTLSFIYACLLTYYSKLICCCQQLNCIYIFINARTLHLSPTANSSRCILVGVAGFEPATLWFQTRYANQTALYSVILWMERRGSNLHSPESKSGALPIKLLSINCTVYRRSIYL